MENKESQPDFYLINADKGFPPTKGPKIIEIHPLAVRILHWNQVFIITLLITCGLYIHYPFFPELPLKTIKNIKGVFNFLLIANTSIYIYYSLVTRHYTELILRMGDLAFLPGFFKYVFFLQDEQGYLGKYNPGQKAAYTLWFFLLMVQIVTGLLLFFPNFFGYFLKIGGGLNNIRTIHYSVTWIFLATIPLHIYLALTEDPAKLQSIFTGYVRR